MIPRELPRSHEGNRMSSVAAQRRARLTDAMAQAGLDVVVLYGNAWQNDYLRYAADFAILDGQGLALARADGQVLLFLDRPLEADRAALECSGIGVTLAPDLVGIVDDA